MRVYVGAMLAAVGLVPQLAFADTPKSDEEKASELREAAADAAAKGDFQTCKAKASDAFMRTRQAQSAGLLGLCESELGEYRSAAEHLDYAIRFDPRSDHLADYQAKLAEAKKHVGTIVVSTIPDGATVALDGKSSGAAPETLFLEPGRYQVSASKDGFGSASAAVDATAGHETPVALNLEVKAAADGVRARPLWPGIAILSAGVVSLGVAGGLLGAHVAAITDAKQLGNGLTCDLSNLSPPCQKLADKASFAQTTGDVSGGFFIAGGVGVALGGALSLWAALDPSRKTSASQKAASVSVVPLVAPRGGGLIVGGNF